MQGKGGEEDMMVLVLAPGAFDVFARDKLGLLVQIDIPQFGLQQLADPAHGAEADPERKLGSFFYGRMPSYFWPAGRVL